MIFRRIIVNAIFVGVITGCLLSLVQFVGVSPIIFAAEAYEVEEPAVGAGHHHEAGTPDHHDTEAWAPEDGGERTSYSILANILASIGFSAVILSLMSQFQFQLQGVSQLNLLKGGLWGLAGFIAFFVAPGIGLPPEIPGVEAAALENRQSWWLLAVIATAVGMAVLAFSPIKYKVTGVIAIALPHVIGAPHMQGPEFSHPDPIAVKALTELHHQFIVASGVTNFIFWIVLGLSSAWVLNKRVLKELNDNVTAPT